MSYPTKGQVLNMMDGSLAVSEPGKGRVDSMAPSGLLSLKQRIGLTVKKIRTEREIEFQKAAERLIFERKEMEHQARNALLHLISDDSLDMIIGGHAKLGDLCIGSIKVNRQGIELFRSGGDNSAHTVGELLALRFEASLPHAGKLLKSPEFLARLAELQAQGVFLTGTYDSSSQSIFVTFDYQQALN
jgi:hypothetical protein